MKLRSPKGPKTRNIAAILEGSDPRILRGIAQVAKEKNWTLFFQTPQQVAWPANPAKIHGLLCLFRPYPGWAEFRRRMRVPVVFLSTNQGDRISGKHPMVFLDDAGCGRLAGEHLLSLSFQNFLTVGIPDLQNSDIRIDAFIQTVTTRAQEVRSILIGADRSADDPWHPLREVLRVCAKPLAIFAPSDWSAMHTMHCVLQEGYHIPEEVAILAAGNEELICENAPVPLSSIDVGHEQLAYQSARLLDDILEGRLPPDPPLVIPNAGIVTRQSTEIIAVSDFQVAKALRFIWMNLDHTLPIQEICAHAGVPQKAMEIRFRNHLGRSIIAEINRARIEKAKSLLRTTDLKAKEIAAACGFTTPNYFNNVFHTATGHAPRKYRTIQRMESGNS